MSYVIKRTELVTERKARNGGFIRSDEGIGTHK